MWKLEGPVKIIAVANSSFDQAPFASIVTNGEPL
jgi:hypothetical protein